MRSSIRALAVAFALLLPGIAHASDFEVTLQEPLFLGFGPAGADFGGDSFDGIFIDGVFQEIPPLLTSFTGDATFVTGAMLSLTVDDSDPNRATSSYLFGPGTFTLTAHWTDQFGNAQEGRYVAPLLELQIDIRCEQELSAQDCGDVGSGEHGSLGDASASFGPGQFDHALAKILGLGLSGGAFFLDWPLDGISGSPFDSGFRVAGSNSATLDIAIPVEIPEPSILSLLLLAPILGRRFRR
jgi:hypothetical protein